MGAPSTPKVAPLPPAPELKKLTDVDRRKARDATKAAAIAKFGLPGTDVTKGSLTSEANLKKTKLGG